MACSCSLAGRRRPKTRVDGLGAVLERSDIRDIRATCAFVCSSIQIAEVFPVVCLPSIQMPSARRSIVLSVARMRPSSTATTTIATPRTSSASHQASTSLIEVSSLAVPSFQNATLEPPIECSSP